MPSLTIACVLVTVAVSVAVLGWLTYRQRVRNEELTARLTYLESSLAVLSKRVNESGSTQLAREVAALRAELEEQRSEWANQRSRLYGKLSALKRETAEDPPAPEDVRAKLRREHLLPKVLPK